MTSIHVYEPALCCNTGVCGPDPDQNLVQFTADLTALNQLGADVTRHNLANDPLAFADAAAVRSFMQTAGADGLPLTTVDGSVVLTGRYPTRAELTRFAGVEDSSGDATGCGCGTATTANSTGCGCGSQAESAATSCGCGTPTAPVETSCGCTTSARTAVPMTIGSAGCCGSSASSCC